MELCLEDPFAVDDACTRWTRDKCPGPVSLESGELLLHGVKPVGVLESGSD